MNLNCVLLYMHYWIHSWTYIYVVFHSYIFKYFSFFFWNTFVKVVIYKQTIRERSELKMAFFPSSEKIKSVNWSSKGKESGCTVTKSMQKTLELMPIVFGWKDDVKIPFSMTMIQLYRKSFSMKLDKCMYPCVHPNDWLTKVMKIKCSRCLISFCSHILKVIFVQQTWMSAKFPNLK